AAASIFHDHGSLAVRGAKAKDVVIMVPGRNAGHMPWTAPQVTRRNTPYVAGERQMLEAWLDFHRQTLLAKCSGLTAGQLRQRAAPPSTLSLLGLVRHMAEVERGWFRRSVAGEDAGFLYSSEADPDGEFDHVDTADAEQDFATYLREIDLARQAAAGRELDETFFHPRRRARLSVRWVYVPCSRSTPGTTAMPTCCANASTARPGSDGHGGRPRALSRC